MSDSQLETLTKINLDDLVEMFGWKNNFVLSRILRTLFISPARTFAHHMVKFDDAVGQVGLNEAARKMLREHYVQDLRVHNRGNIPASGPALFLSNHPGMVDTFSLFAAINRPDLRIIGLHRPFLVELTNLAKQLFYVSNVDSERVRTVRHVSNHLRDGGAVLTFPAGEIEPDPAVLPGAVDWLKRWNDSAGVFIRFARDTQIVPVVVSGVVWDKAVHHPLTLIKRTRREREKLAVGIQSLPMISQNLRPTTVHVRFGKPITLEEVGTTEASTIHKAILERMRGLIENPPNDHGESIL
jgi:1-acyl-sn-glycerol-3-phosphate acyltransferase